MFVFTMEPLGRVKIEHLGVFLVRVLFDLNSKNWEHLNYTSPVCRSVHPPSHLGSALTNMTECYSLYHKNIPLLNGRIHNYIRRRCLIVGKD